MSKIISIHEIELRPGVTAAEFERFLTTEYIAGVAPLPAGWSVTYLKGDRGERAGRYAVLFEVASVADRDRYFPTATERTEAFAQWRRQWSAAQVAVEEKMHTFAAEIGELYTDYTVVAG